MKSTAGLWPSSARIRSETLRRRSRPLCGFDTAQPTTKAPYAARTSCGPGARRQYGRQPPTCSPTAWGKITVGNPAGKPTKTLTFKVVNTLLTGTFTVTNDTPMMGARQNREIGEPGGLCHDGRKADAPAQGVRCGPRRLPAAPPRAANPCVTYFANSLLASTGSVCTLRRCVAEARLLQPMSDLLLAARVQHALHHGICRFLRPIIANQPEEILLIRGGHAVVLVLIPDEWTSPSN